MTPETLIRLLSISLVGAGAPSDQPGASPAGAGNPWAVPDEAAARTSPTPADEPLITAGKKVFAANCAACHGEAGKGDGPLAFMLKPPPLDLSGAKIMTQSDGALFWKITTGRAPMPAFDGILTEVQRWQVVGYLRTLGPTPPRFDAGEDLRGKLSGLVHAYRSLLESLIKGESAAIGRGSLAVVEAIEALKKSNAPGGTDAARAAWKEDLDRLGKAAAGLDGTLADPSGRQGPLTALSEALIRTLGDFGHAETDPLVVFTTPGAAGAAGHVWVQPMGPAVDPYVTGGGPGEATIRGKLAPRPAP